MNKHIQKYNREQQKTKIIELLEKNPEATYKTLADETNTTISFVKETIQEKYATATNPQQILELREKQQTTLLAQTPKLHKIFSTELNAFEKLSAEYENLLDETKNTTIASLQNEYIQDGYDDETALKLAKINAQRHWEMRDQVSKERERTAKLLNQSHRTILEHEKRLADLVGLDAPSSHHLTVARHDSIRVELAEDMRKAQAQINQQDVLDAEVVEE